MGEAYEDEARSLDSGGEGEGGVQAGHLRSHQEAEELAMQIEKGDPGGRVESSQESDRQEERIHIVASAMRRAPSPWLPRGSGAAAARDVDEEVALQVGSNVQVLVCGLARRHQES